MIDQITYLVNFIKQKYPVYNVVSGPVRKVDGKDIVIGASGEYEGITDTASSKCYIRYTGKTAYEPMAQGRRVQYYSAISSCRIVAMSNQTKSATELLTTLIDSVSQCGHILTASNIESTSVFREETGTDLTNNSLTIVAVDFDITEVVSGANCTLIPCDC